MMPKIKKLEKWPFLEQNHGLTLWKNGHFSMFWISCFYSLERRFFVVKYSKRHFLGLYCLKKKVGKMGIFGPKPWVNVFGKMSIFRLFEFFFYSLERRVFVVKYWKDIFLAYIAWKKKVGKIAILDQNHGLTSLEKCEFLDFLNFLFFNSLERCFFVLEYRRRHFPGLCCLKKSWKNGHFWTKTMC